MEFDGNYYMEKFPSQIPSILQENYSSKPRDDQFSLEGSFSSQGMTNNYLQDFNSLENFNLNGRSSSPNNLIFSLQPTSFYSFDNPTPSCMPIFEASKTKPYVNRARSLGSPLVPMVDNNLAQNGGLLSDIALGHPHMMAIPINMATPNGLSHPYLNYRDFGLSMSCRATDEGSSSSPKTDITMTPKGFPTTTMVKKGGRGRKKKATLVLKGQWTIQEDRHLIEQVERYGIRKWSQIAKMLNGRIGKQCRERWHNHLRPNIKKEHWTEEEDRILINFHEKIGNKWAEIAKKLPGRTENAIKNHWNATKRRQLTKRKSKSKHPKQSSLLQEYIKTLSPEKINAGCRKKKPSSSSTGTRNPNNPIIIIDNNIANKSKLPNDHIGSSNSSSSATYQLEPEFDFEEVPVPDFNFDANMFEESSMDSLLDCVANKEPGNAATYAYGEEDYQWKKNHARF